MCLFKQICECVQKLGDTVDWSSSAGTAQGASLGSTHPTGPLEFIHLKRSNNCLHVCTVHFLVQHKNKNCSFTQRCNHENAERDDVSQDLISKQNKSTYKWSLPVWSFCESCSLSSPASPISTSFPGVSHRLLSYFCVCGGKGRLALGDFLKCKTHGSVERIEKCGHHQSLGELFCTSPVSLVTPL